MKVKLIAMCSILSSLCFGNPAKERGYPYAEISNGVIDAVVATETQRKDNYYRGQRFDWSGVIYSLKHNGHQYFGEWFNKFDPYFHDTICGPTEEFAQIGYENAPAGGKFLKIGVGVLKKNEDVPYTFRVPYEILDNGKWDVSVSKNSITYTQILNSEIASYIYIKTVELVPNSPVMKIRHTLKNTGKTTIDTNVYCHNFFMLDNELSGPAITLKFAFEPKNPEFFRGLSGDVVKINKDTLYFSREFNAKEDALFRGFSGFDKVENYDFKLENSKTGAGVRITSDKPLMKVTFWACQKTYCVEPFTKIKILAGEEFSWENTYEFYSQK